GLGLDALQRGLQRVERSRGKLAKPHGDAVHYGEARASADADIAVPAERSLEEEGVSARGLLLIEETEDAERRQQVTGKLDGGRAAPKDGSAAGRCARTGLYLHGAARRKRNRVQP